MSRMSSALDGPFPPERVFKFGSSSEPSPVLSVYLSTDKDPVTVTQVKDELGCSLLVDFREFCKSRGVSAQNGKFAEIATAAREFFEANKARLVGT